MNSLEMQLSSIMHANDDEKKQQDIAVYRHQNKNKKSPVNKCLGTGYLLLEECETRSAQRKVEIGRRQSSESLLHGKYEIRNYFILFAQCLATA